MWNLTGDDIQRAKAELEGRRAAIQADYDKEMKQLETDLSGLEMFERAAVNFVLNFKGEEGPPASVADTAPSAEDMAADAAGEPGSASPAIEQSDEAEPAPAAEPAPVEKPSSRWRMRLSAAEV